MRYKGHLDALGAVAFAAYGYEETFFGVMCSCDIAHGYGFFQNRGIGAAGYKAGVIMVGVFNNSATTGWNRTMKNIAKAFGITAVT